MANRMFTRTHVASVRNSQQVRDGLDSLGFAASTLWTVARWTVVRIRNEPGHAGLTVYLKSHDRYADLDTQSSQRVTKSGAATGTNSSRDTS